MDMYFFAERSSRFRNNRSTDPRQFDALRAACAQGLLEELHLRFPLADEAKQRFLECRLPLVFHLVDPQVGDIDFVAALHAVKSVQWNTRPSVETLQALNEQVLAMQPDVRLQLLLRDNRGFDDIEVLTHARHLGIELRDLADLTRLPLQRLSLESLVLDGMPLGKTLVDALPLADLGGLRRLTLLGLNMKESWRDVGGLEGLRQLRVLLPTGPNSKAFYDAMHRLTALEHLEISFFNKRVLPLDRLCASMGQLRTLTTNRAELSGLPALQTLTQVEELSVKACPVAALSGLAGNTRLRRLSVTSAGAFQDTAWLSTLTSLQVLKLWGAVRLPDLAPLTELVSLSLCGEATAPDRLPDRLRDARGLRHLELIDDRVTFLKPDTMAWLQSLCQDLPALETFYPEVTVKDYLDDIPGQQARVDRFLALGIRADEAAVREVRLAEQRRIEERTFFAETPISLAFID